jgi:hypothetical protein
MAEKAVHRRASQPAAHVRGFSGDPNRQRPAARRAHGRARDTARIGDRRGHPTFAAAGKNSRLSAVRSRGGVPERIAGRRRFLRHHSRRRRRAAARHRRRDGQRRAGRAVRRGAAQHHPFDAAIVRPSGRTAGDRQPHAFPRSFARGHVRHRQIAYLDPRRQKIISASAGHCPLLSGNRQRRRRRRSASPVFRWASNR